MSVCAFGHMYCDGGESCDKRPVTAFALDLALQGIKRGAPHTPCTGMDGLLPCSKSAGHSGPHYFYRP